MKKIAFYGSLRPGCYNFDRIVGIFGKDSIRPITKTEIKGYDMFTVNQSYPGVKESANKAATIVADIVEVSEEAYNYIHRMEIGAGYKEETITCDGHECLIYVYTGATANFDKVLTGDWLVTAPSLHKIKALYES